LRTASHNLAEIAHRVGAELVGDGTTEIVGLGSLGNARGGQLSHLSSPSYRHLLPKTGASAVILKREDLAQCPVAALVADNPYLAFARASQLFGRTTSNEPGIHATAIIDPTAKVSRQASIGPYVSVGAATVIDAGVSLGANTVVGERCRLETGVVLQPNVSVYANVRIGARTVVHSGAVIGAAGFGFTRDENAAWQEIAQLGGVDIGVDVSIGANSCIDCGAIDDTVIEDGVKIDNQVQIGHNCRIGAHSLSCGCVGVAGSSDVGQHCVLAGQVGVGGDGPISICDGVMVSAATAVTQSIDKPGVYSGGTLLQAHNRWRRNALRMHALDVLFKRVAKLEQQARQPRGRKG
jgi:UDP-3-O-[3-hydroxymyristoyl] glucosamine N-acyltransferase